MKSPLSSLLLVAALASGLGAQNQAGRGPGPAAMPKPVQSGQARENVRARNMTTQRNSPEWHAQRRVMARDMLREEHNYRMRVARIERMQALYRQAGRMDRVRELDRLRDRSQNLYQQRLRVCQDTLGKRDYTALEDRIRDKTRLLDRDRDMDADRDRDRDRLHVPVPASSER